MMDSPSFEIREFQEEDGWLRLALLGELDMASAPDLEERLEGLRRSHKAVRMDLSDLDFMDSTGLRIMIQCFTSASADGWRFTIDPDLSPQVEKLFQMTAVDKLAGSQQDT